MGRKLQGKMNKFPAINPEINNDKNFRPTTNSPTRPDPKCHTPTLPDPNLYTPTRPDPKISLKIWPDPGIGPVRSGPVRGKSGNRGAPQVFNPNTDKWIEKGEKYLQKMSIWKKD